MKIGGIKKTYNEQNEKSHDRLDKIGPMEAKKKLNTEQELSQFKAFGYLENIDGITLFIEKGKQILVVREGDRIDGRYLVKNITKKELTMTAMDINKDIHIALGQL